MSELQGSIQKSLPPKQGMQDGRFMSCYTNCPCNIQTFTPVKKWTFSLKKKLIFLKFLLKT